MRADVALSPGSGELQAVHQRRVSRLGRLLTLIRHKPLGAISAFVICLLVLVAIFANQIAPYDPTATHPRDKLLGPSATYRLGTDDLGRDVFSRIVVGARTSLWAGIAATMFGTLLGSLIGMVSGYAGGALDMLIQRIMDSLQVLPLIVLLLVVVVALGPSLLNIIWALSIGILPAAGRIVRGATLVTKSESYVESARIVGAGPVRILIRHILPNVMAPIIVIASITIGGAILAEASLSFLGLGVPPPKPSWGGMLGASGRRYFERAPSLALFPGLAITITVLAFNLLGDTLRDLFDPRLRNR
jgi:ABC-type dipeptide/oligopeptide/nickel transport system permease subunit